MGGGGGGARLPIQGRFAALRAQRLMCAIEFAIQSEGPVAAAQSRGSLVTSPVTNWILKETGARNQQKPAGIDDTSYLLEKAAADLCGVRYSANTNHQTPQPHQQQQSMMNDSSLLRTPSYLDKMPLAQAHYNKRMAQQQQHFDGVENSYNNNNNNNSQKQSRDPSQQQQQQYQQNNNSNNYPQTRLQLPPEEQLTDEQMKRLALIDQRAAMHQAEKEARLQNNRQQHTLTPENISRNYQQQNQQNHDSSGFSGPPSKQISRWGERPAAPTQTSATSRPIDQHTRNVLGLLNSASRKGQTPENRKPKWIQDSIK